MFLVRVEPEQDQPVLLVDYGPTGAGAGLLQKVLLGIENESKRAAFAKKTVELGWSVRALEDAVNKADQARNAQRTPAREQPANIVELERQLAEHLGTKVRLRSAKSGKRGSLTIEFFGPEGFDDLSRRLGFVMRS